MVGVLAGCASGEERAKLPEVDGDGQDVVEVSAAEARAIELARPVEVTGTTEPVRAANLGPQLTARIERVMVEEGEEVGERQPLVRLDMREARLRAAQASAQALSTEAEAQLAVSEHERFAPLADQGTISPQRAEQLQQRRKALEQAADAARAAVQQARADVNQAVVRAPFAGVVSKVFVETGEIATMVPPSPLVRLVDLSQVDVRIAVHERDLARIEEGDSVTARITSQERELEGTITYIRPEVDPRTRAAEVVVRLPNEDGRLRAGLFTEISIQPSRTRDAIVVPRSAVGQAGDDRFVYVLKGGEVERRVVTVAPVDDDRLEVREGLEAGARVVADGLSRLADGAKVRVRDEPTGDGEGDGERGGT